MEEIEIWITHIHFYIVRPTLLSKGWKMMCVSANSKTLHINFNLTLCRNVRQFMKYIWFGCFNLWVSGIYFLKLYIHLFWQTTPQAKGTDSAAGTLPDDYCEFFTFLLDSKKCLLYKIDAEQIDLKNNPNLIHGPRICPTGESKQSPHFEYN